MANNICFFCSKLCSIEFSPASDTFGVVVMTLNTLSSDVTIGLVDNEWLVLFPFFSSSDGTSLMGVSLPELQLFSKFFIETSSSALSVVIKASFSSLWFNLSLLLFSLSISSSSLVLWFSKLPIDFLTVISCLVQIWSGLSLLWSLAETLPSSCPKVLSQSPFEVLFLQELRWT